MSVTFITGTDTGVGKTITTAALVAIARNAGRSPYVFKPAQTGVSDDEPGDLAEIRRLVGGVPGQEGVRLRDPLAPVAAAAREAVGLPSFEAQMRILLHNARWYNATHVEGAGGIRVALGHDFEMLDLADAAREAGHEVEFVVVTRAGLGTLNHTILTVDAIQARGHSIRGLVIGSVPEVRDLAIDTNIVDLPRVTGVQLLGSIPAGASAYAPEVFRAAACSWFG